MRKNLLASLGEATPNPAELQHRSGYAGRGASRSMLQSIEDLAESAKKLVGGEAIVSLDTSLIDGSFVSDRMEDDEGDFAALRDAIARDGQLQPILVRPHPTASGRYMVIFGHRRTRAARELGTPVRAVVREMEQIAHIIAQGQENSRRADLSFVEKALFARKLQAMGQTKDTIKSALGVDDTLLSRMLSIVETIPAAVIDALGAARTVGRDRWEELKRLVAHPKKAQRAVAIISSDEFRAKDSVGRFAILVAELKRTRVPVRKPIELDGSGSWAPTDKSVTANFRATGKGFSLSLASKDAAEFGHYISSRLEDLHQAFKAAKTSNPGD